MFLTLVGFFIDRAVDKDLLAYELLPVLVPMQQREVAIPNCQHDKEVRQQAARGRFVMKTGIVEGKVPIKREIFSFSGHNLASESDKSSRNRLSDCLLYR